MSRIAVNRSIACCIALVTILSGQQVGTLRITVTIPGADGQPRPVPRHTLLISDNPATAAPQQVVTSIEGTAEVRLKPGNYTIESDQPLVFRGTSYQWTQTVDVVAGRDTAVVMNGANAQSERAAAAETSAAPAAGSASAILLDWQTSVVTVWSPTRVGAGFVLDARGLIATAQKVVGEAAGVEVQLSRSAKVAGRVLIADKEKDIAIVWVDERAVAQARPVTLAPAGRPPVTDSDPVFTIVAPLDDQKSVLSGKVSRVDAHAILSSVRIDDRDAGGPLFNAAGETVGVMAPGEDAAGASRAARADDIRAALAEAERKQAISGMRPLPAPLPVEPEQPFEDDALKEAVSLRAGSLGAYLVNAADFDVAIITPVLLYGMQHRADREARGPAGKEQAMKSIGALQEFANWADYVRDYPPVVMIRATPKMVENFWKSVARGAASTQGMSLPAFKHLKAGFARMRLYCGDTEVTPIHPFKIERRVGSNEAIYEGLYVFDRAMVGPLCGTVKLVLFSDKAPDKPDTRTIDPKILQQVQQDFGSYRVIR